MTGIRRIGFKSFEIRSRQMAKFCVRKKGFTLVEMLVTLTILAILAAAIMPLAKIAVKRQKEIELRRNLRIIREAIDVYKKLADENKLTKSANIISLGFLSEFLNGNGNIKLIDEYYHKVFNTMPERTRDNNFRSFELGKTLFNDFKESLA